MKNEEDEGDRGDEGGFCTNVTINSDKKVSKPAPTNHVRLGNKGSKLYFLYLPHFPHFFRSQIADILGLDTSNYARTRTIQTSTQP